MRLKFSELKLIPKSLPLPEEANEIPRKSLDGLEIAKHVPFLTYKFREGICQTFEAVKEFADAKEAFKTAEEKRWYGKLLISNERKVVFLLNVNNDNVYFDHKPKEGTR
jgi:hypothetical protein